MADDSVTVKGSPVRSLQKFIERELTPEQRDEALRSVPQEFAKRMRGAILPTETVPVSYLNAITEAAARLKGEPLEQFARRTRSKASTAFSRSCSRPRRCSQKRRRCGRRFTIAAICA